MKMFSQLSDSKILESTTAIILRAFCSLYISITVPLRFAFVQDFSISFQYAVFVTLDLISTLLFSFELYVHLIPRCNKNLLPLNQLRQHNLKHKSASFHIDNEIKESNNRKHNFWALAFSLLSVLPIEYISIFIRISNANYLMLNRLLRIVLLPGYLSDISLLLEKNELVINIGIQRTWQLFVAMALSGHWCGCMFFLVAKLEALKGNSLTWPQVIGLYEIVQEMNSFQVHMLQGIYASYIQSLYWAYITMITTGFGDIVPISTPETVCAIFTMTLGVMITTCTIANLQILMTNVDAALTSFQNKLELLKVYMAFRRFPDLLQNKIISYYDHQWYLLKGTNEQEFLEELPSSIQVKVFNFMYRDLISSLPILRKANNALLSALTECTDVRIYSPNDHIVRPGELLEGALIVSRGEVEIIKGSILERKMQRYDRFAEESLFMKLFSESLLRAKTFCEVLLLSSDEFQAVIQAQCENEHISQMKETALAISKSTSKANKMFGSAEDSTPALGFQKHCHPNSKFRKFWDCVIFIAAIYYVISIPICIMKSAGHSSFKEDIAWFIIGYCVDLIFIVDMVFKFNFFMYVEEGLIVFDKDQIRSNFVQHHNMAKEIFISFPFDFLAIFLGSRYYNVLRLPKTIRLTKLVKYIDRLERVLLDLKIRVRQSFRRVVKLNFLMIFVCHWVGCIWYFVADLGVELGFTKNWRAADEENISLAISHSDLGGLGAYLRSVYWAIVGMSTVGYGDIIPTNVLETTFATVIILIGGLIIPAIVGGLAAYMANLNVTSKTHKKKLGNIRSYMKRENMDNMLIDKVMRYYDYLWSRQGGIDERTIIKELPGTLQHGVAMHITGEVMNIPYFTLCDDSTKERLVSLFKPRVFLPSENIVNSGERGTEMYFIEKGEAAVSSFDRKTCFCILRKGDYFGESCLLFSCARFATVYALTYCDCFMLSKSDFQNLLSTNDALKKKIIKEIARSVDGKKRSNQVIHNNFESFHKLDRIFSDKGVSSSKLNATSKARYSPDSIFRKAWNFLILCLCIYNAWCIPFRIAFTHSPQNYFIDWVLDAFFVLDMYLNCYEFSFIQQGELVEDRMKMKEHYLSTQFKFDIIMSLPFDAAALLLFNEPSQLALTIAVLRIPKLFRLGRMFGMIGEIFNIHEGASSINDTIQIIQLLSGVVLIAHWAGCGFYAIARWKHGDIGCEHFGENMINGANQCGWQQTWIERQISNGKLPPDGGDTWQQYIRSFHWALPTLVVVVIGDVVPVTSNETLYVFLWIILGVTINATIIGSLANLVANLETDSADFIKKSDDIKHLMHLHNVDLHLQNRVFLFMNYLWLTRRGMNNDEAFMQEIPSTLQRDIIGHSRINHIKLCPFFDFCSPEIIRDLALCLRPLLFSVGDLVVNIDDMGQEMYFLSKGTVEVMSRGGHIIFATLVAGNFFGESSIFFKQKRTTSVKATSVCEAFELLKYDLENILLQRDFDFNRMRYIFKEIFDSNSRRNKAVGANLKASKDPNTKLFKLLNNSSDIATVRIKIERLFQPNSVFRVFWDELSMLFTIYFAIIIPFQMAFALEKNMSNSIRWLGIDIFIDLFFIVDLILRNNFFAFVQNGATVKDKQAIKNYYRRNGMPLDLISCIPSELLLFVIDFKQIFLLRSVHLIRIHRLQTYFAATDRYLNMWKIRISASNTLLIRMFVYYMLVNHWCACIWFIIHRYFEYNVQYTWATTDCPGGESCLAAWDENAGHHNICNSVSIMKCYIRSFYFVITTTSTVGYGDISPATEIETIWENVVVLIGACFLAGIIGAFAACLSNNDTSGMNAFKRKLQKLKEYMKYKNLARDLQNEIFTYYQHRWRQYQVLDERAIIGILSAPLQQDLYFSMNKKLIHNVPILMRCEPTVQKRISFALKYQACPATQIIYNIGDIGWEIFFIGSGLVEVELPTDLKVYDKDGLKNRCRSLQKAASIGHIYKVGNHFGESCLFSKSGVRQETVIARSAVELYVLPKADLNYVMKYMADDEKQKLRKEIIMKNGSVWHDFEDSDLDTPEKTNISPIKRKKGKAIYRDSLNQQKRKCSFYQLDRERLRSFSENAFSVYNTQHVTGKE